MNITVEEYFAAYAGHPDITPERLANGEALIGKVDALLEAAALDGLVLAVNPYTDCLISGSGNGGFRPQACLIGAPKSTHKQGRGVDIYDPQRRLQAWCYRHPELMKELGLTMENGRWTPTWCHLQDTPPGPPGSPWRLDYIPDNSPAKVPALPEQQP